MDRVIADLLARVRAYCENSWFAHEHYDFFALASGVFPFYRTVIRYAELCWLIV